MKFLKNRDGFALITALMFTMLSLVMTMTLLSLVASGIKTSSAMKSYRSTTEAAYGGVDIMIKDIINNNLMNATSLDPVAFKTQMDNYVIGLQNAVVDSTCLRAKLTTPNSQWPDACKNVSLVANEASNDIKFTLNAASGPSFNVYAKIVNTMEYVYEDFTPTGQRVIIKTAGNTDLSTTHLEGAGVVNGGGSTNPSLPYMYRIEVQAQRPAPSTDKSMISVEYVY
jgi:hypothetical protein